MNVKVTRNTNVEIEQRHEITWGSEDPLKFWVTVAAGSDNAETTHELNRGQVVDLHAVLGRALKESDAIRTAKEKAEAPAKKKSRRRSSHATEKK